MEQRFTVQTGEFEGPLELLLELIENRKLHISEVSLAKVADDYVSFIQTQKELPVGDIAHFVLVASTLILIKSRALLPTLELSQEEESDIRDLEYRLKLYKEIRQAAGLLEVQFGTHVLFAHEEHKQNTQLFVPDKTISTTTLADAVRGVIAEFPALPKLTTAVVEKVMSLEEMIERMRGRIQKALKSRFSEMVDHNGKEGREQKINLVVSFLALLELAKQNVISITQDKQFADMVIERTDVGTPHYE